MSSIISFADFEKVDIRLGRVVQVDAFPEGKYSSHILHIDFGTEIGQKKSLARLTPNYQGTELIGTLVAAVLNFPPKQIGHHRSECLLLGFPDHQGNVVLVTPSRPVPLGGRLH